MLRVLLLLLLSKSTLAQFEQSVPKELTGSRKIVFGNLKERMVADSYSSVTFLPHLIDDLISWGS